MPRKYRWPATRLDRDQMHELHEESKTTGKTITSIIADAVGVYLNARLDEKTAAVSAPPAQPVQAA